MVWAEIINDLSNDGEKHFGTSHSYSFFYSALCVCTRDGGNKLLFPVILFPFQSLLLCSVDLWLGYRIKSASEPRNRWKKAQL